MGNLGGWFWFSSSHEVQLGCLLLEQGLQFSEGLTGVDESPFMVTQLYWASGCSQEALAPLGRQTFIVMFKGADFVLSDFRQQGRQKL